MIIDLGCGSRKRPGCFGIDYQKLEGVDLVHDCNLPIPLPDSCAEKILAFDFLEHVNNDKRIHIMNEIWRLLKPGGIFESGTPNAAIGQGAFQDPTHLSFWCPNSFLYYSDDRYRSLYGIKAKFDIVGLTWTQPAPIAIGSLHGDISHVQAILRAVK